MKISNGIKKNRGMTYVELIVVLSIFSVMLSITLYNYRSFQGKVDIKNLANDIALRLVLAQKSSISGRLATGAIVGWKPSYGLYFSTAAPSKFIYFADLNNSNSCEDANCIAYSIGGEVIDVTNITKGNTVSGLQVFGTGCASPVTVNNLTLVFRRPSSSPAIISSPVSGCAISYVAINITSPQAQSAQIKVYPSGRIQIN